MKYVILEKAKKIKIIKPPSKIEIEGKSVFLAGSIEMGSADEWQKKVIDSLKDKDITILNPRRDNWDSSWIQSIENKQFREQVEWELEGQEKSDIIAMYFDPKTKSPITLLELGLFGESKKLVVCCPKGFWRKGNVDVVCKRYKIKQVDTLKDLIEYIKKIL